MALSMSVRTTFLWENIKNHFSYHFLKIILILILISIILIPTINNHINETIMKAKTVDLTIRSCKIRSFTNSNAVCLYSFIYSSIHPFIHSSIYLLFIVYPKKPTLSLSRPNITAHQGETISPLFLTVSGPHLNLTVTPPLPNSVIVQPFPSRHSFSYGTAGYVISGEFNKVLSQDYLVCLHTMEDPVCLTIAVIIKEANVLPFPHSIASRSVLEVFDTIEDESEYTFTIHYDDELVMNRTTMMSSKTVLNLENRDDHYRVTICRTKR